MAQSGHRKMACSLDAALAASWWTFAAGHSRADLEDATTAGKLK
jgi:hypothetical protein